MMILLCNRVLKKTLVINYFPHKNNAISAVENKNELRRIISYILCVTP